MITIYTDGSCLTNPGNGGWAAIINDEKKIRKISGSEKNTTNNRMELLAPINALKDMKPCDEIQIYTDINQYANTSIHNKYRYHHRASSPDRTRMRSRFFRGSHLTEKALTFEQEFCQEVSMCHTKTYPQC